jgi:hypothetical protein
VVQVESEPDVLTVRSREEQDEALERALEARRMDVGVPMPPTTATLINVFHSAVRVAPRSDAKGLPPLRRLGSVGQKR